MEQKEIFELIEKFERSELTKLEIKDGNFSIKMENQPAPAAPIMTLPMQTAVPASTSAADIPAQPEDGAFAPASRFVEVKAPIVGVFYAAPAPDADAYVHAGEKVSKGQVLCLVEAMKMMNELKSPVDGIIKSIKGINGELVEFDQILFEVEPC